MCKNKEKFTIKQFREQYSTEEACLNKVFSITYGDTKNCLKCGENITYKRVLNRRCFQCPKCKHQFYPCAGTIFEKSTTPLMYWFYAIFLFTVSKNGLSAYELQRQLGVTYKTAWRILNKLRSMLNNDENSFSGIVELDETYVGGKNKNRHHNKKFKYTKGRSYADKVPVFGILQRGGKVSAYVVPDVRTNTLKPIIYSKIQRGSTIMTDEWNSYNGLCYSYDHQFVNHGTGNYVKGDCWTNGLENFWSIVKRTINGSYIHVSRKYMQNYINECVFRFNNKNNKQIFDAMLSYVS